jgi:signal transduction histidine kinase
MNLEFMPGETILILAPLVDDAVVSQRVLLQAGYSAEIAANIDDLFKRNLADYGALLLAEEAFLNDNILRFNEHRSRQESWSNIPVVVMTSRGDVTKNYLQMLEPVLAPGNVTLLERPFRKITLIETLRAALSTRRQQYRIRDILRERERILSSITDVFFSVDSSGCISELNANAEQQFFCRPSQEILGRSIIDGTLLVLDVQFQSNLSEAVQKFEERHFEGMVLHPPRWFEAHAHPTPEGIAVYMRDISLRKEIEAQEHMWNSKLERRVVERTSELIASNAELKNFSYAIAHNLRAPLRAISGYTDNLLKNSARSDYRDKELLGRIAMNASVMGQLVDGLLEFSRLGRQPLKKSPINLELMAREIVLANSAIEEWRKAAFTFSAMPDATGDPLLIRLVLLNLLSNAVKFSRHQSEPVITFNAKTDKRHGSIYCISDNGVGFDTNYYTKMFGVFERLHSPGQFEGTGIGLALCKRIIDRHGGKIWAEGSVGKGAAFYFTLPQL